MLKSNRCLFSLAGALILVSSVASGQIVFNERTSGDLQIVDYSGKPPYKRQVIAADELDSDSAIEEMVNSVLVVTGSRRRSGPPGKSLPAQVASIERVSQADISQIARFEETDSSVRDIRRWRGAPGKGRKLVH